MATSKKTEQAVSKPAGAKRLTRRQLILRRFLRNRSAVVGLIFFAVIVFVALFWKFPQPMGIHVNRSGQVPEGSGRRALVRNE